MNKIYEEITNKILDQLHKGIIPWEQPWFGQRLAISYATGRPYSFLNMIVGLGGNVGEFITWHQIQKQKAHLRRGSKGWRVYFWDSFEKKEVTKDGETVIKTVPYLRVYTVFAVDDVDGIERRWQPKTTISTATEIIKHAEDIANNY